MGSQPADSGNRIAAIEPIAGISLPLQCKQISSSMPVSASTNSGKPIAVTNERNGFQWEIQDNYQQKKELPAISSLQREPHVYS